MDGQFHGRVWHRHRRHGVQRAEGPSLYLQTHRQGRPNTFTQSPPQISLWSIATFVGPLRETWTLCARGPQVSAMKPVGKPKAKRAWRHLPSREEDFWPLLNPSKNLLWFQVCYFQVGGLVSVTESSCDARRWTIFIPLLLTEPINRVLQWPPTHLGYKSSPPSHTLLFDVNLAELLLYF